MLKTLLIIIAIPLSSGVLRAQEPGADHPATRTPEFGEKLAAGKPACALPRVTIDADFWLAQLPLDLGSIYMPKDYTAQPRKHPSTAEWMAPDGTKLDVRVDSFPIGVMSTNASGAKLERSPQCVVAISGHHAVVDRLRITTDTDTYYLAMIPVFAASGRVINATIQATSEERRDDLLAHLVTASLTEK